MTRSAEQYRDLMLALQPPGSALPRDIESTWARLLLALAGELARIDGRTEDLVKESDPRTTFEMLSDWERVLGLPDDCVTDPLSVSQRRDAVVAKLTTLGSMSKNFYIAIAATMGFTITIDEFEPFTCDSTVDTPLYGMDWQFCWRVNAPEQTVRYWTVDDDVSMPLAAWGNQLLECVLNRIKPAHTVIDFSYGG